MRKIKWEWNFGTEVLARRRKVEIGWRLPENRAPIRFRKWNEARLRNCFWEEAAIKNAGAKCPNWSLHGGSSGDEFEKIRYCFSKISGQNQSQLLNYGLSRREIFLSRKAALETEGFIYLYLNCTFDPFFKKIITRLIQPSIFIIFSFYLSSFTSKRIIFFKNIYHLK